MSDTPTIDDPTDVHPGYRKAFVIGTIVVALVVAVALGYAWVRDPGPQPSTQPTITGTDNGGLKRAIIHYLGALESKKPAVLVDVMGEDNARTQALAKIAIEDYGDSAQKPAKVVVKRSTDFGELYFATITFEDGRAQEVESVDNDDRWRVTPQTDQALPEVNDTGAPPVTVPSPPPSS